MTATPTALERLRAHVTLELARHDDTIGDARRQIASLVARDDMRPQAMLQDLGVLERRVRESASARWAYAAVLELLDQVREAPEASA